MTKAVLHQMKTDLRVGDLIAFLSTLDPATKVALRGGMGGTVTPLADVIVDDLLVAPDDPTFATIASNAGKAGFPGREQWLEKGRVILLDSV